MQRTMRRRRGRLSWVVRVTDAGQACLARTSRFCWSHLCIFVPPVHCRIAPGSWPLALLRCSLLVHNTLCLSVSGHCPSAPHVISMLPSVNDLCFPCLSSLLRKTRELKGQWVQEGTHLGADRPGVRGVTRAGPAVGGWLSPQHLGVWPIWEAMNIHRRSSDG